MRPAICSLDSIQSSLDLLNLIELNLKRHEINHKFHHSDPIRFDWGKTGQTGEIIN